jgi:glucosamine 6-phosphate synthetase-like amidotransferase/phosphosugar isomerase protein
MCGIIGVVLGDRVRSAGEYERIRENFSGMLVAAQVRGVDASGLYIVNAVPDGSGVQQYVYSAGIPAGSLVTTSEYWKVLDNIGPDTIAIVGHTRHATTGLPSDNSNNHPIIDGPLVGVHNGVIWNHEELRYKYGAVAEVDSATILSTLNAGIAASSRPNAVLELQDIRKAMPEVDGSWAIAVSDSRRQAIFLARNSGAPIQLAKEINKRALWFASTNAILSQGLGVKVESITLPAWTCTRLTRSNANTGNIQTKAIETPKAVRPVDTYGLEDWQRSTGLYERPNGMNGQFFTFFDEGATTAAALKAAEKGE